LANRPALGRSLPTIVLTMGGMGGRSPASGGKKSCYDSWKDGVTGVVMAERFFLFDGLYVSEKVPLSNQ
jgi:hypothetical protein